MSFSEPLKQQVKDRLVEWRDAIITLEREAEDLGPEVRENMQDRFQYLASRWNEARDKVDTGAEDAEDALDELRSSISEVKTIIDNKAKKTLH